MLKAKGRRSAAGFLLVGALIGATVSITGIASGSPSSLQTCTKGATIKILKAGHNCAKKYTKVQYDNDAVVRAELASGNNGLAAAQKYKQLLRDFFQSNLGDPSVSTSYAGMDFSLVIFPYVIDREPDNELSNGDISFDFSGGNFTNATFLGSDVAPYAAYENMSFRGANFAGAFLDEGDFQFDDFSNANFTNADLGGADFGGSDMVGVTVDNTFCPDGHFVSGPGSCTGHGF